MTKYGFIVNEGVVLDQDQLRIIASRYFIPGEKVVPTDPSCLEKVELTIKSALITLDNYERPVLRYQFEGDNNWYDAHLFDRKEGFDWRFGMVITIDEQTWLVPFSPDDLEHPRSNAAPLLIDAELMRGPMLHFGIESNKVGDFFENFRESPLLGEIYLIPMGNNHYQLDNSPWWATTGEAEIAIAKQAIIDYQLNTLSNDAHESPSIG